MQQLDIMVDLEPLLTASGEVSRDGLAMIGEIFALSKKMANNPHRPNITLKLVSTEDQPGGGLEETIRLATGGKVTVEFTAEDPNAGLSPPNEKGDIDQLFITANQARANLDQDHSWLIGEDPLTEICMEDIPRRISEKLDIPIPRPMDPARRKGELLSLDQKTTDLDLQSLVFEHPSTDWIVVGDCLFLYLEDPDKADAISQSPNVEHISYSVAKPAIFLTQGRSDIGQDKAKLLTEAGGWQLLEAPYEEIAKLAQNPKFRSFSDWSAGA